MFETRSHAWREAGLLHQISPRAISARGPEVLLLVPLFVAVVVVHSQRQDLLGVDTAHSASEVNALVNVATAIAARYSVGRSRATSAARWAPRSFGAWTPPRPGPSAS